MSQARAAASQITQCKDVSIDNAYEVIERMTEATRHDTGSLLIVSGNDKEHGSIHVVVPPLGNASLLPFATQSALL